MRDDAIIATGRTDYPNQVNNVLCFPYIFRGALDCGATTITTQMEIAAVHAIAELAQAEQSEVVAKAYAGEALAFGPEYLIPKPFDPRLMMKIAPAVAQAALDSGVALRPIADMDAYRDHLQTFVYASGCSCAHLHGGQDGDEEARCLCRGRGRARAARGTDRGGRTYRPPTLIGRPDGDCRAHRKVRPAPAGGPGLRRGERGDDHRYRDFWQTYHRMTERKGVTVPIAKIELRRRLTLIGSMLLHKGEVDGLICGTWGHTAHHLQYIDQVIGRRAGVRTYACMNALMLPGRQLFVVDTHVNYDPSAEAAGRDHHHGGRGDMCALASSPRRRCCRTPTLAAATSPAP